MSLWTVLHTFTEGVGGETIIWFEKDYLAVRDGEDGHTGHSEVETHLETVRQTIEDPDFVKQDKAYDKRRCYYLKYETQDGNSQFMKVVVENTWYGKIRVVTAYFTLNHNSKEKLLWKK